MKIVIEMLENGEGYEYSKRYNVHICLHSINVSKYIDTRVFFWANVFQSILLVYSFVCLSVNDTAI